MASRKTQLFQGCLELLTLKIIAIRPSSRADVRRELQRRFEGVSASSGSITPLFKKLLSEGFIVTCDEPRARKNAVKYALTEAGKARTVELSRKWRRFSSAVSSLVEEEAEQAFRSQRLGRVSRAQNKKWDDMVRDIFE